MSFLLTCPNCGAREVTDFAYGGEVVPRPTEQTSRARAQHLQLLPPQRRRRPARVVVPPLRLPGLVPGRARHHHQRGELGRAARESSVTGFLPAPNERIDRGRRSPSSSTASRVEAYEGDTIGSALHASGRRMISRSFKYHRPRGLLCCAGQCPNCLVEVDGWPGVRACTEPVRQGMDVRHMNASPSLEFDAMRATDLFGSRLTPPGFYYKTFIRPRRLWPLYERVLRHAAGLGKLPKKQARAGVADRVPPPPRRRSGDRRRDRGHGGRAASRRAGRRCRPRRRRPRAGWIGLAGDTAGEAKELAARVAGAGVEILAPAAAIGWFDGLVPVWCGSTLHQIRAGATSPRPARSSSP